MYTKLNKHTLLVGEGTNQHTLYGDFLMDLKEETNFKHILVDRDCSLKHEKPDGSWSNEHKTLKVEKGNWVMGVQVEYNPMRRSVGQIFD